MVAVCKNDLTKHLSYSSQIESGVLISIDDKGVVHYRFAVNKPITLDVQCENSPSDNLVDAVKQYLDTFKHYEDKYKQQAKIDSLVEPYKNRKL